MADTRPYLPGRGYATDAEMLAEQIGRLSALHGYGLGGGAGYQLLGVGMTGNDPLLTPASMFNDVPAPQSGGIGGLVQQALGLIVPGLSGSPETLFKTKFNMAGTGQTLWASAMSGVNTQVAGSAGAERTASVLGGWNNFAEGGGQVLSSLFGDDVGSTFKAIATISGENGGVLNEFAKNAVTRNVIPLLNGMMGYDRGAAANIFAGSGGLRVAAAMNNGVPTSGFSDEDLARRGSIAANASRLVNDVMYGKWERRRVGAGPNAVMADEFTGEHSLVKGADMHHASEALVGQIVARTLAGGGDLTYMVDDAIRGKRTGLQFERSVRSTALLDGTEEEQRNARRAFKELVSSVTGAVDSLKDFTAGNEKAAADMLDLLTGGRGLTDSRVAKAMMDDVDWMKARGVGLGMDPSQIGAQIVNMVNAFTSGRSSIGRGNEANGQFATAMTDMLLDRVTSKDPREQQRQFGAMVGYARSNASSRSIGLSTLIESLEQSGAIDKDEHDRLVGYLTSGTQHGRRTLQARLSSIMGVSGGKLESMLKDKVVIDSIANTLDHEHSVAAGRNNAAAMSGELNNMAVSGRLRSERDNLAGRLADDGFRSSDIVNASARGGLDKLNEIIGRKDNGSSAMVRRRYEENLGRANGDASRAAAMTMSWVTSSGILDSLSDDERVAVSEARNAAVRNLGRRTTAVSGQLSRINGIVGKDDNGQVTAESIAQAAKSIGDTRQRFGDVIRGKDGKPYDMSRDLDAVGKALARGDVAAAQSAVNGVLDKLDPDSRKVVMTRLGEVKYRTVTDQRKGDEKQEIIREAMADEQTSRYFAGMSGDYAFELAKTARKITPGMPEEERRRVLDNMRKHQEKYREDTNGDLEKMISMVEFGDVTGALDVLRNSNVNKATFRKAMEDLGAKGLRALTVDERKLRGTLASAVSADSNDYFAVQAAALTGAAGDLGAENIAGLGGNDLKNYLSLMTGRDVSEITDEDVRKFTAGDDELNEFDVLNNRGVDGKKANFTADQRKAAAVSLLTRQSTALAGRHKELSDALAKDGVSRENLENLGEGYKGSDWYAKLNDDSKRRVDLLASTRAAYENSESRLASVSGMGADDFAAQSDALIRSRDRSKEGKDDNSLFEDLIEKIGELVEKIGNLINSNENANGQRGNGA